MRPLYLWLSGGETHTSEFKLSRGILLLYCEGSLVCRICALNAASVMFEWALNLASSVVGTSALQHGKSSG